MHIFTAAIATETNSFSPIPTNEANFADDFHPAGSLPDTPVMFAAPMQVARRRAAEQGWRVTEGLAASAQPSGLIRKSTWEAYRDRLLADLQAAGPVDVVLLGLHGAMMADGYPDCEGDLLGRVRAIAGAGVVIGGLLDPHCHLTPAMLAAADVLIAYKHYPHLDAFDRAEELWQLCTRAAQGLCRPVMASSDCRMISLFYTPVEPMRGFVAAMTRAEQEPGILSVSLIHGFPWGDVAEMGTRMLVISDGDAAKAQSAADGFAQLLQSFRGSTMTPLVPVVEAVKTAAGHNGEAPLVLADFADNCGAGAPSDATFLLDALIRADVPDVAIAFLHDPQAIDLCKAGGVGARMPLRVGGKTSRFSGPPLDLDVEVMHIAENARHDFGIGHFEAGTVVVVRTGRNVDIVMSSNRIQCITPAAFSDFGIDPASKRVLVPKSMQHFYIMFSRLGGPVLYVESPGVASMDLPNLPYARINRDIWPFNAAASLCDRHHAVP
ncbi:MAG: M81 family metallopeptidase [Alphaproteobacteria bacterium]|nr:M81 family metallopeptidase [Alphaproteobacteria bacterium]